MSRELKEKILSQVVKDLEQIEVELADNLHPYLELVSEVARHILFSGGKRLRPLLMVLSARLCGCDGGFVHRFATIFEYLHAATLLHDDVVDGAAMRRGRAVAHTLWDPAVVVLVGDFLLARSLTLASETGRPQIIRVIAEITENMSQGEIQQLVHKGSIRLSEADYMEVIRRKTAVLFRGACRVSGILADVSEQRQQALADYGGNLGLAFQMADDLLDYTVDSAKLGKLVGADLREGKLTLPVIYTLKQAGGSDRWQMVEIVRNRDFSPEEFRWLIERLHKYGGIEYTQNRAREHIESAKLALVDFEDSAERQLLLDIADYALLRQM